MHYTLSDKYRLSDDLDVTKRDDKLQNVDNDSTNSNKVGTAILCLYLYKTWWYNICGGESNGAL